MTEQKFNGVIYLSVAQYNELTTNGTVTIDGEELVYDKYGTIYITPDNDKVSSSDLTANLADIVAQIPTKTSQLENDNKFVTEDSISDLISGNSDTYTKEQLDTKFSTLEAKHFNVFQHNGKYLYVVSGVDGSARTAYVIPSTSPDCKTLLEIASTMTGDAYTMESLSQYGISWTTVKPTGEEVSVEIHAGNFTYDGKIIATVDNILTKTSQLTNDSGFVTGTEVDTKISALVDNAPETLNTLNELATALQANDTLTNTLNSAIGTKADKTTVETLQTQVNNITVPTKLSDLTDDKGYLTSYTETDPTVPAHVKSITENDITKWNNKVESTALSTVATSGNYNDLINKPTIPDTSSFITKDVSNLTNYTTTSALNSLLSGKANDTHNHTVSQISDAVVKYVHELYIAAGGAGGSFEVYTRLYTDSATPITVGDLVTTYSMTNKLANINGYVAGASGTNVVYNMFFESAAAAHFNGATLSCTGSDITVQDTVVGRLV